MQHFDTRCNFYFGTQWVENVSEEVLLLKFVYSEKATKFCEIFTSHLTGTTYSVSHSEV